MDSPSDMPMALPEEEEIIAATRRWVDRAVIGLNLCPFAKAVQVKNQIRYCVSRAQSIAELSVDLIQELRYLAITEPSVTETTLLLHPAVLQDFMDYNDYLNVVEQIIEDEALTGIVQVASFHPDYQFADAAADDRSNFSNRSPYPCLHLLREDSISSAIANFPDPESIYERNIRVLRALSPDAFRQIWQR